MRMLARFMPHAAVLRAAPAPASSAAPTQGAGPALLRSVGAGLRQLARRGAFIGVELPFASIERVGPRRSLQPASAAIVAKPKPDQPRNRSKSSVPTARFTPAVQQGLRATRCEATAGLFGAAQRTGHGVPAASAPLPDSPAQLVATLFAHAQPLARARLALALYATGLRDNAQSAALGAALASACNGDTVLAARALQRLQTAMPGALAAPPLLPLTLPTALPATLPMTTPTPLLQADSIRTEKAAWLAAARLSATPSGLHTLQHLAPLHNLCGRAERALLQATASLLQTATSPLTTGTDDASRGADAGTRALASQVVAAATRMQMPGVALDASEKAAIFAWEQGFRSSAVGSPLDTVQQRLTKFSLTTIPRATARRLRSFFPRLLGQQKTALAALARLPSGSPPQPSRRASRRQFGAKHYQRLDGTGTGIGTRAERTAGRRDAANVALASRVDGLIDTMQSSGRLRLADGARHGISTRGLSLNLASVLHLVGIPIGPRLTLAWRRSRRAVFDVSCGAQGGEIRIGSEREQRREAGLGVMLGYDLHAGPAQLRCGASLDAVRARETCDFSGVILRVLPTRTADGARDDAAMKRRMRALTTFLFEQQRAAIPPTPAELFERFAVRFFDDPAISIDQCAPRGKRRVRTVAFMAGITALVRGTPLRVGPGVGVSRSRVKTGQRDIAGANGRHAGSIGLRAGQSTTLALSAGVGGRAGAAIDLPGTGGPIGAGMPGSGLPSWNKTLVLNGRAARARLHRHDGTLQHETCVVDMEFHSAEQHLQAVTLERQSWIDRLSDRFKDQPDPRAAAEQALDDHLQRVRAAVGHHQMFVQRSHLRADVAVAIDRHIDMRAAIDACTYLDAGTRKRLCASHDQACAHLLQQAGAWVPLELKIIEKTGAGLRLGVQAGLQMMTESSLEREVQTACLKAPVLTTSGENL